MRSLLLGIVLIILVGVGGLVYRNAIEYPTRQIACPMDAQVCPNGTTVSRTVPSCTFSACLPPNVSLPDIGIAFALPTGFVAVTDRTTPDAARIAMYQTSTTPLTDVGGTIIIRRYAINTSMGSTSSPQATALATIQQTAIGGASGLPVSVTSFTSTVLGTHRFTVVTIERFVNVAYYLARGSDVLRFDAIDRGVDWTNPSLDITKLPTQTALRKMLTTLQGE
ncbi:hypothetical protein A3A36_01975 [Candidatus Kaiserbacteria bacterium RIFCSPLOWO2_01_FULL_52_12b]|uniref:Uncharacterized protein n=1 Tax=Candidatus Kaiserbacteria bacterium RIFCSPLOWO2_01_FULL_52_12b TaxID=1798509 RepID=A0A1F6EXZ3_9BACT|nr:MAG: hypothetical protein A3A36_01975 [Candidatus Kaiserbacteria bacterium RIFCSPLOWO2_01_FULL_52_12b]